MATRAELRTRARVRADQDASTFPSDTQYNSMLDEAAKDVWYDFVSAGWPALRSDWTTSTQAGVGSGVPTGATFIIGVYRVDGSVFTELRRLNEGDRATMMSPTGGPATHYIVESDLTSGLGPVIWVYPPSAITLRIEYIQEFAGFTNDASVWFGPPRSDQLIVLRAAAAGCRKEDNEPAARALDREYDQLLEKSLAMASWLDMRNPATIRDVGGDAAIGVPARDPFDFNV